MRELSVLMATYNASDYVREAIQSVINQTFTDYEFIIVDDGSSDDTMKLLLEWQRRDKRIVVIPEEHHGLTRALIVGSSYCSGRYLARIDADDVCEVDRFEKQVNFLRSNSAYVAVGSLAHKINRDGHVTESTGLIPLFEYSSRTLRYVNYLIHGTVMMDRRSFSLAGGYIGLFPVAQDYDLWLRLSRLGNIKVLNDHLYRLRIRSNSVSVGRAGEQLFYACLASATASLERCVAERPNQEVNIKKCVTHYYTTLFISLFLRRRFDDLYTIIVKLRVGRTSIPKAVVILVQLTMSAAIRRIGYGHLRVVMRGSK